MKHATSYSSVCDSEEGIFALDEMAEILDKARPLSIVKTKEYIVEAECSSDECYILSGKSIERKAKNGIGKVKDILPGHCNVIKNVSKHAVDCPDCGNVLFWVRKEV